MAWCRVEFYGIVSYGMSSDAYYVMMWYDIKAMIWYGTEDMV